MTMNNVNLAGCLEGRKVFFFQLLVLWA